MPAGGCGGLLCPLSHLSIGSIHGSAQEMRDCAAAAQLPAARDLVDSPAMLSNHAGQGWGGFESY